MRASVASLVFLGLVTWAATFGSVTSISGCSSDDATGTTPPPDGGVVDDGGGDADAGCADCTQCGIEAPILQDAVQLIKVGKDEMNRAAVLVNVAKAGECRGGTLKRPATIHILSATVFDVAIGEEKIDVSVTDNNGQTYTWKDRTLTMTVQPDPPDIVFGFTGDATLTVFCKPNGDDIDCTSGAADAGDQ